MICREGVDCYMEQALETQTTVGCQQLQAPGSGGRHVAAVLNVENDFFIKKPHSTSQDVGVIILVLLFVLLSVRLGYIKGLHLR